LPLLLLGAEAAATEAKADSGWRGAVGEDAIGVVLPFLFGRENERAKGKALSGRHSFVRSSEFWQGSKRLRHLLRSLRRRRRRPRAAKLQKFRLSPLLFSITSRRQSSHYETLDKGHPRGEEDKKRRRRGRRRREKLGRAKDRRRAKRRPPLPPLPSHSRAA